MKYFAVALSLLLSSVALSEAAGALRGPSKPDGEAGEAVTLPNGISCRMCPDDDNYFWPDEWTLRHGDPDIYTAPLKKMKKKKEKKTLFWWRKLESAADAAKAEAEYLTEAAKHQVTEEHKAAIEAAAEEAHYEARVLAEAVEAESPEEHDRLLKERTLPNGISCRMCPDDDNYFWPDDWTLQHGWPH
eukprot:scaffold22764_cov134-Cylindrotheca_fusiformis.AAC.4